MILEEFDENKTAIINPDSYETKIPNFPKIGITCFSKKLMDRIVEVFKGEKIAEVRNANGETPVWAAGMSNWVRLKDVPELSVLLNNSVPPPMNL